MMQLALFDEDLRPAVAPPELRLCGDPKAAAKLRALADRMTESIDAKLNPATAQQNPTRRRAGIIAGMEADGRRLQQTQALLYALADRHEAGTLDLRLFGVKSKSDVETLLQSGGKWPRVHIDHHTVRWLLEGPYNEPMPSWDQTTLRKIQGEAIAAGGSLLLGNATQDIVKGICGWAKQHYTGRNRCDYTPTGIAERERLQRICSHPDSLPATREALLALLQPATPENSVERQIREAERALIGVKIPGYFWTPPNVVAEVIDRAGIEPGMRAWEPSAGKGDIALAARAAGAEVDCCEIQTCLRAILQLKGLALVGEDCTQHTGQYDRVVMNPPFENGQDMDHVRHAFDQLLPGGRLVSVMSPGPFFRQDSKAQAFRAWLDDEPDVYEVTDLPDKSFERAGTGVATKLVVIDR